MLYYRNKCFAHLSFLYCIRKTECIHFPKVPKSVWNLSFSWIQRNETSFLFYTNSNSEFNGASKPSWKQMKIECFGGEESSCDKWRVQWGNQRKASFLMIRWGPGNLRMKCLDPLKSRWIDSAKNHSKCIL